MIPSHLHRPTRSPSITWAPDIREKPSFWTEAEWFEWLMEYAKTHGIPYISLGNGDRWFNPNFPQMPRLPDLVAAPTRTTPSRVPTKAPGQKVAPIKAGIFRPTYTPPGKPARVIPADPVKPSSTAGNVSTGVGQLEIVDMAPGPMGHVKVRKGRSVYTVKLSDVEIIRRRKYMVHERPVVAAAAPAPSLPPVQSKEKPMDLGAITGAMGDLANIYTQVRNVNNTPQVQPAFFPALGAGVLTGEAIESAYNYVTGSTPKRRRRRRRLATVGDIKDLAALKAVLGNGEAFKTWIATHSR